MRLRPPASLVPIALTLLLGCATGEEITGARVVPPAGGTSGTTGNPTGGNNASPTPSPTPSTSTSPTPTPSPSASNFTSGIETEAPPASVETLPTTAPAPTSSPTPVGTVIKTSQLSDQMLGVGCPPRSNTLWLLGSSDLYTTDADSGFPQAQGLSLPSSPVTFRFGPNGDMWVIGGTTLKRYVPQLMDWAVQSAPLPATAFDLAVDSNEAWVVTTTGVSRFQTSDLSRTDFAIASPTAIALDASNAWVTSASDDTLYQLNRSNGTVTWTYATGAQPRRVAIDGLGGIWTANQGSNSLTHLPAAGGTPTSVGLTGSPTSLLIDGNTLWVGRADSRATWITATETMLGTTTLPFVPATVTQDANGQVWFLDVSGRSLAALKGR